jgi:hypothetical protein
MVQPTSAGGFVAGPLLLCRLIFFFSFFLGFASGYTYECWSCPAQRDQAKAILSKQAVKIATKAEQHERFIFKVISPTLPPFNLFITAFLVQLTSTNLAAPVLPFFCGGHSVM